MGRRMVVSPPVEQRRKLKRELNLIPQNCCPGRVSMLHSDSTPNPLPPSAPSSLGRAGWLWLLKGKSPCREDFPHAKTLQEITTGIHLIN